MWTAAGWSDGSVRHTIGIIRLLAASVRHCVLPLLAMFAPVLKPAAPDDLTQAKITCWRLADGLPEESIMAITECMMGISGLPTARV
jgi:hypothetical protein